MQTIRPDEYLEALTERLHHAPTRAHIKHIATDAFGELATIANESDASAAALAEVVKSLVRLVRDLREHYEIPGQHPDSVLIDTACDRARDAVAGAGRAN